MTNEKDVFLKKALLPPFKFSGNGKIKITKDAYIQLHNDNYFKNTEILNFVCRALENEYAKLYKDKP